MSNYNKSTNFSVKDTLASGDPDKIVSGAEIDNEFNSISSAITSKVDKVASATNDNLASLDSSGNVKDSGLSVGAITPPTGSVVMNAATTPPSGWLACDGSEINRATFANLFNVIGTTYGNGNGSTTFTLPDLRGEFVRGWDDNRGVDTGRNLGSFQDEEFKSHDHSMSSAGSHTHSGSTDTDPGHRHDYIRALVGSDTDRGTQFSEISVDNQETAQTDFAGQHSHSLDINSNGSHTHNISDAGGAETRPRNIALMYIIKT